MQIVTDLITTRNSHRCFMNEKPTLLSLTRISEAGHLTDAGESTLLFDP